MKILYHPKRILGFEPYVAPDDFDRKAQPVDIYDVFERYYRNHRTAKHIYSFTSDIATLTLGAVSGVSYRWGETIGGIDSVYDVTSGTAFTAGSTKRYVIVLSTAASMNCSLPLGAVWAYKTTSGYFSSDGNSYLNYLHTSTLSNITTDAGILRNTGLIGTVTIPPNPTGGILGPTVGRWFQGCGGLTKVILNGNSRELRGNCFLDCSGITEVVWAEGVKIIGVGAFRGCSGLTGDLTLPNSVTTINVNAFNNCTGLNGTLTIGTSTTSIGSGAFGNCNFTSFDVSANSRYEVDDYILYELSTKTALHSIKSYTGSLTLRSDTLIIGAYCFFNGNTRSGNLIIPNSVTTIDASAFQNCTMTGTIMLSNTLATLGVSAFSGSLFSGNLALPDSITVITDSFRSMVNMTGTLTLGNAVTQIDGYAFDGNNFTGSLTIPSTCNSIGARCFRGGNFNGALTINSPNISIHITAAIEGAFTELWLCASYSSAYLLFAFSNNFSAISLDSSLKNITDGTSLAWKTFTIGATNKARLLAAYPNAETDANARYIYVV